MKGCPSFIFFEGPPSANGHPGIRPCPGTFYQGYVLSFQDHERFLGEAQGRMGYPRLPVELGVEKELGITKEDIGKTVSIEEYNRKCRTNVMKYTEEWTDLSHKMGYWVDMEHPYITYDNKYIENALVAVAAALPERLVV